MSDLLKQSEIDHQSIDTWEQFLLDSNQVSLIVGPLHNGFVSNEFIVITEVELFPNFIKQSKRSTRDKNFNSEVIVKDLTELNIDDPVVHEHHGVGRYKGLVDLNLGDGVTEFLQLHYANEDKLYVPVSQLHSISRYSGGPMETAPLHKLGSGTWEKAKRKALIQIHDTAADLLNLYSKRSLKVGYSSKINLVDYDRFVEGFPFEETPDQKRLLKVSLKIWNQPRPMDRLICGDVGFGKTEVAMRAAFTSVSSGKQVIILVPTTLLADQHLENFRDRFCELAGDSR